MAHEIVMPQLSLSMDKGQIVKWLKQTGDQINAGDILLEVESDKSIVEVEAVESGILQIVLGPTDGEISVGTVIAYTHAAGEVTGGLPSTSLPVLITAKATGLKKVVSPNRVDGQPSRRLPSSPSARRRATELKIDWQQATGTGRDGRIKERDVLRFYQETTLSAKLSPIQEFSIQLTPLARRIADNFGMDDNLLAQLAPGKPIVDREDVEEAIRKIVKEHQFAQPPITASPSSTPLKVAAPRRETMGIIRKRIAEKMMLSKQTYAPVTLTTEIDASELVQLRETMKTESLTKPVPSYNVLITKIVAKALVEYPDLNASLEGSEIVYWPTVNIGIAVDTERGLVVPVAHDVGTKSIDVLIQEINDLTGRAAQGKATPDDLNGATFTITNLGVYEVDAFTPIINPPECSILGIGRLRKQMVVINDQPSLRTMCVLSLTFDHRLVDGAVAARFLQYVKHLGEQPYSWLI